MRSLAGVLVWAILVWSVFSLTGCREDGSAVILSGTEDGSAVLPDGTKEGDAPGIWPGSGTGEDGGSPAEGEEGNKDTSADGLQETTVAWIYVHVCGQVCEPGVYVLAEGSRVWDAVKAAGGLTEDAEPAAVNLALAVADGSKVTIPSRQEAKAGFADWYETGSATGDAAVPDSVGSEAQRAGETGIDAGLVDINRADIHALMTIPGIGQVRAEAIVAHRQRQGPFGSIEEIMNVTGIKEGLFAKIRDYITVGG